MLVPTGNDLADIVLLTAPRGDVVEAEQGRRGTVIRNAPSARGICTLSPEKESTVYCPIRTCRAFTSSAERMEPEQVD